MLSCPPQNHPHMDLPPKNPFIAKDFQIISQMQNANKNGKDNCNELNEENSELPKVDEYNKICSTVPPTLLPSSPRSRLFYKLDREFLLPKASVYVKL